jgi:hypothetical protein
LGTSALRPFSQKCPRFQSTSYQFVKGAVPDHHGLVGEPLVQGVAVNLAVPERVVAPGNEGYRGIIVRSGEGFKARCIGLRGGGTGEFAVGQGPAVRCQKGELGQHGRQGRVDVGIDEARHQDRFLQAAVHLACACVDQRLQGFQGAYRNHAPVRHRDRRSFRQCRFHGDNLFRSEHHEVVCQGVPGVGQQ